MTDKMLTSDDIKYMAHSGEGYNSQKQTDAEEVRASFQQANSIFFDEVPCRKFDPERDMDTEFIRDFKSMAEFQRDMPNEHQNFLKTS